MLQEKSELESYLEKSGLYILKDEDAKAMAECTAVAYNDYSLLTHFYGGKYSSRLNEKVWLANFYALRKQGVIYADSKEVTATAIALPRFFKKEKTLPFLLNGGLYALFAAGTKSLIKMQKYEDYSLEIKKKITNLDCIYLNNLSVRPEFQGQGFASKLFLPVFRYADEKHYSCYLETHTLSNTELYKHYGFDIAYTGTVPMSNLTHYAMIRNPKQI